VFVCEYVETNADKAVEMKGTVARLPVDVAMETRCVLRSSEQWPREFIINKHKFTIMTFVIYIISTLKYLKHDCISSNRKPWYCRRHFQDDRLYESYFRSTFLRVAINNFR
jgi:hypothetical protein